MNAETAYRFRLFIAGDTPNSALALANLTALCNDKLPGRHEIVVVDVFREPGRALAEGILMTPTLLKMSPAPVQRIVGSLADIRTVVLALGLEAVPDFGVARFSEAKTVENAGTEE